MPRSYKFKPDDEAKTTFGGRRYDAIPTPGIHILKIDSWEEAQSKKGNPMYTIQMSLKEDSDIGFTHFLPINETNDFFRAQLKGFLVCMGVDLGTGEVTIRDNQFEGLTLGGEIVHELYNGNDQARLKEMFTEADARALLEKAGVKTPDPVAEAEVKYVDIADGATAQTGEKVKIKGRDGSFYEAPFVIVDVDDNGQNIQCHPVNEPNKVGSAPASRAYKLEADNDDENIPF